MMEEAKNMRATSIFMASCFAKGLSLRLNSTGCNVSLVFDDDTPEQKSLPPSNGSGILTLDKVNDSRKPDIHRRLQLVGDRVSQSLPSVVEETRIESEDIKLLKPPEEIEVGPSKGSLSPPPPDHTPLKKASGAKTVLELPIPLSRELITKIENELKRSNDDNDNNVTYTGCLPNGHYSVLVKKFNGDCNGVFEAEKKAAMSMCHRNIQGLIGYHKSDDATFLVFPNAKRGTLAKYLLGTKGKEVELAFSDKVKIAIGIAQGLRYMHHECPRGPIVHGNLVPPSIVLGDDFLPQITNFEKATWLHQEQASPISTNRSSCKSMEHSDHKSLNLIKADILSFGVLLLRLFCHKWAPRDSKLLVEWAKPLVLQRAFHILLGENEKGVDPHELYMMMTAAIQCTRTRPILRPCMSEVVSLFQGQMFCCIESSPSDNSE